MRRLTQWFKRYRNIFLIFAVVLFARLICMLPSSSAVVRSAIELFARLLELSLFFAWGLSMRERVVQTSSRRFMMWSVFLVLLLLLSRDLRFLFFNGFYPFSRYLWYSYYGAVLFLPLLNFFAALCVGNEETYRVPKKLKALYLPATALLVCVLTNDMHGLVFRLIDAEGNPERYTYGPLYYAVVAWVVVLMALLLLVLVRKCQIADSRRRVWAPLVVLMVGAVHLLLLSFQNRPLFQAFHLIDVTLIIVTCDVCLWEACMSNGLMVSNSRFGQLFSKSTLRAQILDDNDRVCYAAERAVPLSPALVRQTRDGQVMLDENTRLCRSAIHGGSVLWTEDISSINRLIARIQAAGAKLEESNRLLSNENEIKKQILAMREQNRLYGKIADHLSGSLTQLEQTLEQIAQGGDPKTLFPFVCVQSAYLKRKINLLLLAETNETLPLRELELSVGESLHYAALCGVTASLCPFGSGTVPSAALVQAYDAFENALEPLLRPQCVTVVLERSGGVPCVVVTALESRKAGDGDAG